MPPYDPESEVTGKYLIAFVEAAGEVSSVFEEKTREIFEEHTDGELESDGWYKADNIVEAYDDLLNNVGKQTMKQGGLAAAETLPFSEDISLEEAFDKLSEEHKSAYRNSDMEEPAGNYVGEVEGPNSARVAITDAYPYTAPFAKGVFEGVIERWGGDDPRPHFEEIDGRKDENAAWKVDW